MKSAQKKATDFLLRRCIGVVIDPSLAMAKLALERGIDVRVGGDENLPSEDSHFDVVLLVTTIFFLDNVPAALGEASRVLTPGGCLLVGLVDRESTVGRAYESSKQEASAFYRDATVFSTEEVVVAIEHAGFCYFVFRQPLFQPLNEMTQADPVKLGYGKGAFVVVRGTKFNDC